MLGNCWLVKKLPNYELFLTNSSPDVRGFHQFVAIYFTQLLGIYYQQYFLNLAGNLLPSSWIIWTVFSFMLGKISWAMKGWSKIMRKILPYRSLPKSG